MASESGAVRRHPGAEALDVSVDVLVIGGGPAGAWAAVAAAEAGARVILVDKGYLGTSGATAPSNTGTWFVPPGEGRRVAIEQRQPRTGGLADPRWVERTLDTAWEKLHRLAAVGLSVSRRRRGQAVSRQSARPGLHALHASPRRCGRRHRSRPSSGARAARRRRDRRRGRRDRSPAQPAVARPRRRGGAGDRRLRLRRAHAGRGDADRRRLPDGRRGGRRAVRHGVLGAVCLHPEAERAQQGAAVPLGELHPARRHADRDRGPRPLRRGGRGLARRTGLRPVRQGRARGCDRGSGRVSRTAFCRSTGPGSIPSPSAGR